MRRRITLAILVVTAGAIACFGIPLAVVIHHLYIANARGQLEREATLATRDVPNDFATGGDPIDLPSRSPGITIGLYSATGDKISGDGPTRGDAVVLAAAANAIRDHETGDRLVAAVPVAVNERVVAVIRAETSTHPAEHRAHLAWALMAALGTIVVAAAGTMAVIQANRLTRPLRTVRDSASRLGHGDFAIAAAHSGIPELDDVADALTSTARRLGQTLERERAFSTHASHQLRTPLAGLRVTIETELAAPRPDPTQSLNECLAITDRLEATITNLLRLARETTSSERLDLTELVNHARSTANAVLTSQGRRLELPVVTPTHRVDASNAAITQALDVLIDNAVRHGHGTVTLTTGVVPGGISIAVTDDGPGPLATAGRRNGAAAHDHGIGLQLAATLVEAEGGRLLHPQPTQHSTFSIVLPAVNARASTSDNQPTTTSTRNPLDDAGRFSVARHNRAPNPATLPGDEQ